MTKFTWHGVDDSLWDLGSGPVDGMMHLLYTGSKWREVSRNF
jgi:hypothetical protein